MKVVKIIDSEIKSGVGKKGKWSMARVELDNGKEVNMFNPVEEGVEVEAYENDGYTNYRPIKKAGDAGNSDYDKAFKYIFEQNKTILEGIDTLSAMVTDLAAKIDQKAPEEPVVTDVDEPIDLDEMPL